VLAAFEVNPFLWLGHLTYCPAGVGGKFFPLRQVLSKMVQNKPAGFSFTKGFAWFAGADVQDVSA
jgi:hypothetical protein